MTGLDWAVLVGTTAFIVVFGIIRSRGAAKSSDEYLRGGNQQKWPSIGLAVMATQASAITFISTPGQGYEDGLRFAQFYLGLPLAMILISAVFIPIFYRLKVTTAYQYLESRFDLKTRLLGAALFLIQRGLASGITLYAPAIILSTMLGWRLEPTVLVMGVAVIIYTVSGGSKAVSQTQQQQMVVMLSGMVVAGVVILFSLPSSVSAGDALEVAGAFGRLEAIDFSFNPNTRYTFWSGITGGFFLQLSYFGTDQSQVGRYLSGQSITESRLGLLFNGVLKIPMQVGILAVGVLVFVFYQFTAPPLLFNDALETRVMQSTAAGEYDALKVQWQSAQTQKREAIEQYLKSDRSDRSKLSALAKTTDGIRADAKKLVTATFPGTEVKDSDYVFIGFVKRWLPSGVFGLLMAVIFAAAMSAIASGLQSLGATTTVDFYKRVLKREATDQQVVFASKAFIVFWGVVAIGFATFASMLDNLIQAVNILGSLFYGTVLGLFVVAFFFKRVAGTATFIAALASQVAVILLFLRSDIGYLWFNLIGCVLVVVIGSLLQLVLPKRAALG